MNNLKKILSGLNRYAQVLEKASVWHNSKEALGNLNNSKDDYVYEFYCYLRIIKDLKKNYFLEYCNGAGKFRNKFPKKPSSKKDKPFFLLLDKSKKVRYQICAGTKIKVQNGEGKVAPDISFQIADSPDEPDSKHVKIIMDAKYTKKKDKPLGRGEYYYFSGFIQDLGLTNPNPEKIEFDTLGELYGNCLITYGKAHTNDKDNLNHHRICELEYFNEEDTFRIIK